MRILVVEDDERIVSFMKRGLEAEGFMVDVASGRSSALDLITGHIYDLVVVDIFLGADDGLDVCRTIRKRKIRLPILMMTAKGTLETEQACKEAGADAYLPKPFAFDDLVGTIVRLCASERQDDSNPNIGLKPSYTQGTP